MKKNNFNSIYLDILKETFSGVAEINKRTNSIIYISPKPLFFEIDLNNNYLPIAGNRTIWPYIAAAELAWQLQGTKNPAFITKYAPKIWSDFIENGQIKTAYGYRWKNAFGRDQINLALKALKKDPTNRQIYISNWDPMFDGLGEPNQPKNIPCPIGFSLNIIDQQLNMSVFIRSSDIFVGLPYDILTYSLTLDLFATSLGIEKGNISFTLAHAHLYECHMKFVADNITNQNWENINIEFQSNTIEEVEKNPDNYVIGYKNLKINNFHNPKPEIVK